MSQNQAICNGTYDNIGPLLDRGCLLFQMGLQCYFLKDRDYKIVANSLEINQKESVVRIQEHSGQFCVKHVMLRWLVYYTVHVI